MKVERYGVANTAQEGIGNARLNGNVNSKAFSGIAEEMGQFGQSLNQVSNDQFKIAMKEKEKHDSAMVMEADQKLNLWEQDTLHDGEKGFYAKKGKDAIGSVPDVKKSFDDLVEKTLETLQNDIQKQAFTKMVNSRKSAIGRSISAHERQERQVWRNATEEAGVADATAGVINNFTDEERIAEFLSRGERYIMANAEGKPAEATKAKIEAFKSLALTGAIKRMAEKNSSTATDFYNKYKDLISGNDHIVLEKTLSSHSLIQDAVKTSDEIMSGEGTYEERLKKAHAIEDPRLRDEVVSRVKVRTKESEEIKLEQYKTLKDMAFKAAFDGAKGVEQIEGYVNLEFDDQQKVRKILEGDVKTDPKTLYTLSRMSVDDFAKEDLLNYVDKLSPSDWQEQVKKQEKISKGSAEQFSVTTTKEKFNKLVDSVISDKAFGKMGTSNQEAYLKLERRFNGMMTQRQSELGRELNPNEVQDLVDALGVEIVTDHGTFWNTEDYAYTDDNISSIIMALQSQGIEPTQANIQSAYDALKKQGRIK